MTFIGIPDEKVCWSRCYITQKAASASRAEDDVPSLKQAQYLMAHVWDAEDSQNSDLRHCLGAPSTGQRHY